MKNFQKDIKEDEKIDDEEDWKSKLLDALLSLSPSKFELFCRALVTKMNVAIDETIGTKLTGDGGLDGYGYIRTDDFRTARVAIQAKRWILVIQYHHQKLISFMEQWISLGLNMVFSLPLQLLQEMLSKHPVLEHE